MAAPGERKVTSQVCAYYTAQIVTIKLKQVVKIEKILKNTHNIYPSSRIIKIMYIACTDYCLFLSVVIDTQLYFC